MIKEEEELAKAATMLARTMPKEWENFLTSFKAYAERQITKLVYTTHLEVNIELGKSRALADLYNELKGAPETVDKLDRRSK